MYRHRMNVTDMTWLANGADATVIVGVIVTVPVYLFTRKRAASADVLEAVSGLRDEMLRDLGRIEADVKDLRADVKVLRTEVAGIDRRLVAIGTILAVSRYGVGAGSGTRGIARPPGLSIVAAVFILIVDGHRSRDGDRMERSFGVRVAARLSATPHYFTVWKGIA